MLTLEVVRVTNVEISGPKTIPEDDKVCLLWHLNALVSDTNVKNNKEMPF